MSRSKCDAEVRKLSKFRVYWEDVPCQKNAKFEVEYKLSESSLLIKKDLCTIHRNKLLKEIDADNLAVLVSCKRLIEH